jgi:UDP-2,3-diacylglucosamine pyrophosphatase LpxH
MGDLVEKDQVSNERRPTPLPEQVRDVALTSTLSDSSVSVYRSLWISDLHLGTRACKADALLAFLQHQFTENLYLVGDIIDGWSRGGAWFWSPAQEAVVRTIAQWRREGVRVVFISGNHDETELGLVERLFSDLPVQSETVHSTLEGRRMLVTHGHQFDSSLSSASWVSLMGGQAYNLALRITDWYSRERLRLEQPWLTSYLKRPMTKTVGYLTATDLCEREIVRAVLDHRADGIICGHTHRVEQRLIDSIWYINDGDWVSNCTALVEHRDGTLGLLKWDSSTTIDGASDYDLSALTLSGAEL